MRKYRSEVKANVIREAWAAWRMGLVMPGIVIDGDDPKNGLIVHGRRAWLRWKMSRMKFDGPMLPN